MRNEIYNSLYSPFILGQYASVGISRTQVDNTEMADSLIARLNCIAPGDNDVDKDLIVGLRSEDDYSKG